MFQMEPKNAFSLIIIISLYGISQTDCTYDASIIKRLLADYDWKTRPFGKEQHKRKGGPLMISVNILLRTISKIDDVNMEFSTQFTFRQSWNDHRLAYGARSLPSEPSFEVDSNQPIAVDEDSTIPKFIIMVPGDLSEQIWIPDTFFQNEKSAKKHLIDKPNVLIRIYPNGDVLYSVRLSLVLSCPMSLVFYPMDEQDCFVDFSSYAYTMDDIQYTWSNESPVQMKDTVKTSLPSFDLEGVETKRCVSNTSTGEYSCLRVHLQFKRMFSYYLIQLYIPSFMLVIVSWVSFWVDKSSVPARVTLGVTTLLTITTQASGINAKLPPVSYTKAIDVWIGVCLAFVFGALLEYALVNYADDGHFGRRYLYGYKSYSNRYRMSASVQAAAPMTAPFCPSCGQSEQVLNNRPNYLPNCNQGPLQASPLLARWSDVGRPVGFPQTSDWPSTTSSSPFNYPNDHSANNSTCSTCVTGANLKSVRSAADRRLPFFSTRHKSNQGPLYKRAGRWAMAFYNEADRAKKIDVISRVLFPLFFLCFNCIYWTVY